MQTLPFEVRDGRELSVQEFFQEYAIPGKPVILTNLPNPLCFTLQNAWEQVLKIVNGDALVTPMLTLETQHEDSPRSELYPTTLYAWFKYCKKLNKEIKVSDIYSVGHCINDKFRVSSYTGGCLDDNPIYSIDNVLKCDTSMHRSAAGQDENLILVLESDEPIEIGQIIITAPPAARCCYHLHRATVTIGDKELSMWMSQHEGSYRANSVLDPPIMAKTITIKFCNSLAELPIGKEGPTIDVSYIGLYTKSAFTQSLPFRHSKPYVVDFNYIQNLYDVNHEAIPPFHFRDIPPVFEETIPIHNWRWMYVGPPGTRTPTHVDVLLSHAWLYLLDGSKHFRMIHAQDTPLVQPKANIPLPLMYEPDLEMYPGLRTARVYEGTLQKGQILFTPANAIHSVINLTSTLSVTHNYVDWTNICTLLSARVGLQPNFMGWAQLIFQLKQLIKEASSETEEPLEILKNVILIQTPKRFPKTPELVNLLAQFLLNRGFLDLVSY